MFSSYNHLIANCGYQLANTLYYLAFLNTHSSQMYAVLKSLYSTGKIAGSIDQTVVVNQQNLSKAVLQSCWKAYQVQPFYVCIAQPII